MEQCLKEVSKIVEKKQTQDITKTEKRYSLNLKTIKKIAADSGKAKNNLANNS